MIETADDLEVYSIRMDFSGKLLQRYMPYVVYDWDKFYQWLNNELDVMYEWQGREVLEFIESTAHAGPVNVTELHQNGKLLARFVRADSQRGMAILRGSMDGTSYHSQFNSAMELWEPIGLDKE